MTEAYAEGAALHDAVGLAEAASAEAVTGADSHWPDLQQRADALTRTLYALQQDAPGERDRARVAEVITALHAVRSAMASERAPHLGGRQQAEAEGMYSRLRGFEYALSALRPSDDGVP